MSLYFFGSSIFLILPSNLFLEPQFLTVFYYENIQPSVPTVSFSSKFPILRAPVTTSLQMTLYFLTTLSSDCFPDFPQCFLVSMCRHQQGTLTSPQSQHMQKLVSIFYKHPAPSPEFLTFYLIYLRLNPQSHMLFFLYSTHPPHSLADFTDSIST